MATRIGINGFGRIGRQLLKAIMYEYEGEIDPSAENFDDLFTDEYLDWAIERDELYREAERECNL
jgi:glyceraldehyde-3-phosphate dehydrogenase/erythrose-4-phosphate dehydrogenase